MPSVETANSRRVFLTVAPDFSVAPDPEIGEDHAEYVAELPGTAVFPVEEGEDVRHLIVRQGKDARVHRVKLDERVHGTFCRVGQLRLDCDGFLRGCRFRRGKFDVNAVFLLIDIQREESEEARAARQERHARKARGGPEIRRKRHFKRVVARTHRNGAHPVDCASSDGEKRMARAGTPEGHACRFSGEITALVRPEDQFGRIRTADAAFACGMPELQARAARSILRDDRIEARLLFSERNHAGERIGFHSSRFHWDFLPFPETSEGAVGFTEHIVPFQAEQRILEVRLFFRRMFLRVGG